MSDELLGKHCIPCRSGVPPLTEAEAAGYFAQTPGWMLADGASRIERRFKFQNFNAAHDFVNGVARLAEEEGHHPDICFGWGWATVAWQTKKINGLHENDFIMAAKTSRLAGQQ